MKISVFQENYKKKKKKKKTTTTLHESYNCKYVFQIYETGFMKKSERASFYEGEIHFGLFLDLY